jgi:hypothetical protein
MTIKTFIQIIKLSMLKHLSREGDRTYDDIKNWAKENMHKLEPVDREIILMLSDILNEN